MAACMGFLIASSGRCGTMALCHGLDRFSDHRVAHEPTPNLLEEAWLKHTGRDHRTEVLRARMDEFAKRAVACEAYGESFRAPNLLDEIQSFAPATRFLIIVRDPLEYARSAHFKRVFRKHNDWDRWRIVPPSSVVDLESVSLAEKLVWHWRAVNERLLEFAESAGEACRVVIHGELRDCVADWSDFIGLRIEDPEGLSAYLAERPNSSATDALPEGYDPAKLRALTETVWERSLACAAR